MVLEFFMFDVDVRVCAVVANKVDGMVHRRWIEEAVESLSSLGEGGRRWKDSDWGNSNIGERVFFAGTMPKNIAASVPERHLGL